MFKPNRMRGIAVTAIFSGALSLFVVSEATAQRTSATPMTAAEIRNEMIGKSFQVNGVGFSNVGLPQQIAIVTFENNRRFQVRPAVINPHGIAVNYEWWINGDRICTSVKNRCYQMYRRHVITDYQNDAGTIFYGQ